MIAIRSRRMSREVKRCRFRGSGVPVQRFRFRGSGSEVQGSAGFKSSEFNL
jgi:hypothetical protein